MTELHAELAAFCGTTVDPSTFDRGMGFTPAPDGTGFTARHSFIWTDGAGPQLCLLQGSNGGICGAGGRRR